MDPLYSLSAVVQGLYLPQLWQWFCGTYQFIIFMLFLWLAIVMLQEACFTRPRQEILNFCDGDKRKANLVVTALLVIITGIGAATVGSHDP